MNWYEANGRIESARLAHLHTGQCLERHRETNDEDVRLAALRAALRSARGLVEALSVFDEIEPTE